MKRGDILITKNTEIPLLPEEALYENLRDRAGHILFRVNKIEDIEEMNGEITTEVFLTQLFRAVETHVPLAYVRMRFNIYKTAEEALAERLMA